MTETRHTEALPHTRDPAVIERLERLANLMDSAVRVPGTGIRVGLDSIVGLVPGVGDTLALAPAAYIIGHAWKLGAPRPVLARMAANTAIDTVIGSIPLLGDIFDVGFKSNRKNVALLRTHLDAMAQTPPPTTRKKRAAPRQPFITRND